MGRHIIALAASASLAATLCSACGVAPSTKTSASSAGACNAVSGTHHASLVVQHGNGSVVKRCVGYDASALSGTDLMTRAQISFSTQTFSFGTAVCAVDHEPAHYSRCLPSGAPYWALWQAHNNGAWKLAATGLSAIAVHSGDSLGWRYTPSSETNPAPPPSAPKT